MGFKFKKVFKTAARAVAAYYTGGASEMMLAKAKAAGRGAGAGLIEMTVGQMSGLQGQAAQAMLDSYQGYRARPRPYLALAPGEEEVEEEDDDEDYDDEDYDDDEYY